MGQTYLGWNLLGLSSKKKIKKRRNLFDITKKVLYLYRILITNTNTMKNSVPTIDERIVKKYVTSGFLSTSGKPTQNSVMMFTVYLQNVPKDYNGIRPHKPSVDKVREFFGVDYGFEEMIHWGMNPKCSNSKTSKGRHTTMSKAYSLGRLLSESVIVSDKKLKVYEM
jgi:hypothetical protein